MKVFNPFPLKKLNEYVTWKEKNVFPTSLFGYHGPPFLIRYLNVLCVPCQELVRLTCGTRPGNSVLTVTCPVVDRSQLMSNGHKRMHNGYLQDAERTRTGQTAYQRTSNVQNLPTDKTGQNGHQLTRNAFTARGTDKKRMRTDTNGLRILLSVTRPLALSGI